MCPITCTQRCYHNLFSMEGEGRVGLHGMLSWGYSESPQNANNCVYKGNNSNNKSIYNF